MPVAYPRHDEAVIFEQFHGTIESARKIGALTKASVYLRLPYEPTLAFDRRIEQIEISLPGGGAGPSVNFGDVVICKSLTDPPKVQVLKATEFNELYSLSEGG